MPDLTVACVLRSGGIYDGTWVHALQRQVARWAPEGTTFRALIDAHPWPGWWAKMGVFDPALFSGRVLYLDLDTDVVGPLDWATEGEVGLALLSDFYRPGLAQSGVMLFEVGSETERLWRCWSSDPEGYMRRFRGDGEWLHAHAVAERIQDRCPGRVVSHKVHSAAGVPEGASLVCYHGSPKRYPDGVVRPT